MHTLSAQCKNIFFNVNIKLNFYTLIYYIIKSLSYSFYLIYTNIIFTRIKNITPVISLASNSNVFYRV
jgi:hypothetical protein